VKKGRVRVIPIPTPAEGNELYPLPPDYEDGTQEYQRAARVNAVRQDMLHTDDLALRALRVRESMRFYDLYYLHPDPDDNFDSYFYDMDPLPTPDFHYRLYEAFDLYRMNVAMAPRGAAKSSSMFKVISKRTVTIPKYTNVYATSTQPNAIRASNRIRDAIYNNQRIHDDFGPEPEFDGKIRPGRGDLPTGSELFYLSNRSGMQAISAQSRQRGMRPRAYWLDDPEYDPSDSTDVTSLREGLKHMLDRVVLPMLFRAEVSCNWVGTFVSKGHLLWAAMETTEDENGNTIAVDPQFNLWNRIMVPVSYKTSDGKEQSCWPEMWPLTIAEKEEKGLHSAVSIEEMPEIIGVSAFRAEMEGKPGETGTTGFGDITDEKHGYWLEEEDDEFFFDPLRSAARVCWWHEGEKQELQLRDLLRNSVTVAPMDTAFSTGTHSDYKVVGVGALLKPMNTLFVLDMFDTKNRQSELIAEAYRRAVAWRCSLHPEWAGKQGPEFERHTKQYVRNQSLSEDVVFVPPVIPHKVGPTPKSAKIAALSDRFERGLIKFPFFRQSDPTWARLFHQIREFNPDVRDGNLKHDDHIDVVQMMDAIIKPSRAKMGFSGDFNLGGPDLREALIKGKKTVQGIPTGSVFQYLTVNEIQKVIDENAASHRPATNHSVV